MRNASDLLSRNTTISWCLSIDIQALPNVNTVGIFDMISFGDQAVVNAKFLADAIQGIIGSYITNERFIAVMMDRR